MRGHLRRPTFRRRTAARTRCPDALSLGVRMREVWQSGSNSPERLLWRTDRHREANQPIRTIRPPTSCARPRQGSQFHDVLLAGVLLAAPRTDPNNPSRSPGRRSVSAVGTARTVAVVNQKGGVGKTTTTLGLASAAREASRRILVVDLDPQASSTWILGIDPDDVEFSVEDVLDGRSARPAIVSSTWGEEVDVLPSSRSLQSSEGGRSTTSLRRALNSIQDSSDPYDAILIDCPPALGSITESGLAAARHALIVVEPSALGLRGVEAVADTIDRVWEKQNPDLEVAGVIVNRVPAVSSEADRQLEILNRTVGRRAVWEPYVPQRVILAEAISARLPIHDMGARANDVAYVFDALWRRLWRRIKSD